MTREQTKQHILDLFMFGHFGMDTTLPEIYAACELEDTPDNEALADEAIAEWIEACKAQKPTRPLPEGIGPVAAVAWIMSEADEEGEVDWDQWKDDMYTRF